MAKVRIKTMKDGLPVVLQNPCFLPDGSSLVESWDRMSDTVTVTVKPVDSEELTVLKFARIQYEDLIRGIRKSNP